MDPYNAEFNRLLVSTYKSMVKVEELMLRDMSQSDLSICEMHILESIARDLLGGIHISDIAQDQGVTLPSVTTSVQKLERKGYVTKERNAFDARRVRVKLTEKGRRAEIAHRYFHRQMVKQVTQGMQSDERAALLCALARLNDFLNQKIEADRAERGSEGGAPI